LTGELPYVFRPFERLSFDILTMYSQAEFPYALVMVDHATRFLICVPLKTETHEEVAEAIYKHVIEVYGPPAIMLSDRGFQSDVIAELFERFGVVHVKTSPYHPEANGANERVNRTILTYLRALGSETKRDWTSYIGAAVYCYNTTYQTALAASPYFLMYGRWPRDAMDHMIEELLEYASDVEPESQQRLTRDDWEYRLQMARYFAQQHLVNSRRKAAKLRDEKRVATETYVKVGDVVFYKPATKLLRKQKLEPYAEEKYTVTEIQGNQVTMMRVDGTKRLANVQDLEVFAEREPHIVDVYQWVQELARQKLREKKGLFEDSDSDDESEMESPSKGEESPEKGKEEESPEKGKGSPAKGSAEASDSQPKRVPDRVIDFYRNAEGRQWVQLGYAGRPTNYTAYTWFEIPSPPASAIPNLMDWLKEYKKRKVYGPYTMDLVRAKESVTATETEKEKEQKRKKKLRKENAQAKRDERDEATLRRNMEKLRADAIRRRR
jgi:hypothetical protein